MPTTRNATAQDRFTGIRTLAAIARQDLHPAIENVQCEWRKDVLLLRGSVPTFYFKQLAQEAAARIPGVARVDSQIEVRVSKRLPR